MPNQTGPAPVPHAHRGSSPGAVAAPIGPVAFAASTPPTSPGFPAGHEHPSGPANIADPGPVPPLFAATMPVHPVHRHESTPNPPARSHDNTSPGLYATIDNHPISTPLPKRSPWTAVAVAGGAVVLLGVLIGGAFAVRHKDASTTSGASGGSTLEKPATSVEAPAVATPAAADTSNARAAMTPSATSATSAAAAPVASGKPSASPVHSASPRAAPATPSAVKPAAPAPPRNGPSPQGAEKDGYVKTL